MDEELREELREFKQNLQHIMDKILYVHKIALTLDKFCKAYVKGYELIEVGYLAEQMEKNIADLAKDFYLAVDNNAFESFEDAMIKLKKAIANHEVELVD